MHLVTGSNRTAMTINIKRRKEQYEKQADVAAASIRETARWMVGGVTVAIAAVIAGTSLSALAAPANTPGELRLVIAVGGLVVGFAGLSYLLSFALRVIVPPGLTLADFGVVPKADKQQQATGDESPRAYKSGALQPGKSSANDISKEWREQINHVVEPIILYATGRQHDNIYKFCKFLDNPRHDNGAPYNPPQRQELADATDYIAAVAKLEYRRLLFRELSKNTFWATPLVAIGFVAFVWAANTDEAGINRIAVFEKEVPVHPDDKMILARAFGDETCAVDMLRVLVLGEWPSGAQEIVTTPRPGCAPIRLRLDHGRFSAMR